jgi:hypothetical protein
MTDLFADPDTTIGDAIYELEREANMRRRVYPRWIEDRRLSAAEAETRQRRLQDAIDLLRRLREEARYP